MGGTGKLDRCSQPHLCRCSTASAALASGAIVWPRSTCDRHPLLARHLVTSPLHWHTIFLRLELDRRLHHIARNLINQLDASRLLLSFSDHHDPSATLSSAFRLSRSVGGSRNSSSEPASVFQSRESIYLARRGLSEKICIYPLAASRKVRKVRKLRKLRKLRSSLDSSSRRSSSAFRTEHNVLRPPSALWPGSDRRRLACNDQLGYHRRCGAPHRSDESVGLAASFLKRCGPLTAAGSHWWATVPSLALSPSQSSNRRAIRSKTCQHRCRSRRASASDGWSTPSAELAGQACRQRQPLRTLAFAQPCSPRSRSAHRQQRECIALCLGSRAPGRISGHRHGRPRRSQGHSWYPRCAFTRLALSHSWRWHGRQAQSTRPQTQRHGHRRR